jgi:hypothetical protein
LRSRAFASLEFGRFETIPWRKAETRKAYRDALGFLDISRHSLFTPFFWRGQQTTITEAGISVIKRRKPFSD